MTLPFVIDPLAWPLTILGILIAFWVYTRPTSHFIKQLGWYMASSKSESYHRLFARQYRVDTTLLARAGRVTFWLLILPLVACTMLSLLVCVGVLKNPPLPTGSPASFDPSKFEIVTEGKTIYARPKAAPTSGGG